MTGKWRWTRKRCTKTLNRHRSGLILNIQKEGWKKNVECFFFFLLTTDGHTDSTEGWLLPPPHLACCMNTRQIFPRCWTWKGLSPCQNAPNRGGEGWTTPSRKEPAMVLWIPGCMVQSEVVWWWCNNTPLQTNNTLVSICSKGPPLHNMLCRIQPCHFTQLAFLFCFNS